MTVDRIGGTRSPGRVATSRPSSATFRLSPSDGAGAQVAKTDGPVAVGSMLALLEAQSAGDAQERNARAKREGFAALGDLRSLQLGLLEGGDPGQVLERLERLSIVEATDPGLRDIIEEVRARVLVEVARRRALARRNPPDGTG